MSPWCVSSWLNYEAADFCTWVMKRLAGPHLSAQNQVHQLMGNTSRPRSNRSTAPRLCVTVRLTTSPFSSLGISCNWDFLKRIYCFYDFTQCLLTLPTPCMNMPAPLLCTAAPWNVLPPQAEIHSWCLCTPTPPGAQSPEIRSRLKLPLVWFCFLCPASTSPHSYPCTSSEDRSLPGLGFMPSIKQAVKRRVLALRGPWLQNS